MVLTPAIFYLIFANFLQFLNAEESLSTTNPLEIAQEEAKEQGSLLLVDFYSEWCKPCIWMEDKVFSSVDMISMFEKDVIHLHVNIDDKQGFELKNTLDVEFLPTLLIYNPDGHMLYRSHKTHSENQLLEILKSYKQSNYSYKPGIALNQSPKNNQTGIWESPSINRINSEGTDQYMLQVAALSEYSKAWEVLHKIQKKIPVQTQVDLSWKNDKILYRIMLGPIKEEEKLKIISKYLKEELGLDSFIKVDPVIN